MLCWLAAEMGDSGSVKLVSRKRAKRNFFPSQDQNPVPDDSSAQDSFQSDVEQVQHPLSPPQTTENGSPDMIVSGPLPGSLEYSKEPSVSLETGTDSAVICAPDNSVGNLTEGSLIIHVDCHSGSPTGPCINGKVDSPPQPKSILKTRSVDPDVEVITCRGVCKCPRCLSTRDQSEAARGFIKSQMNMANNITTKLITELRNIRTLVEDDGKPHAEGEAATSCGTRYEKV